MQIQAPEGYAFLEPATGKAVDRLAVDDHDMATFGVAPQGRYQPPGGREVYGGSSINLQYDASRRLWVVATGPTPQGFRPWAILVDDDGSHLVPLSSELRSDVGAWVMWDPHQTQVVQFLSERAFITVDLPGYVHWYHAGAHTPIPLAPPVNDPVFGEDAGARAMAQEVNRRLSHELEKAWAKMTEMNKDREALTARVADLERRLAGVNVLAQHIDDAIWAKLPEAMYDRLEHDAGIRGMVRRVVDVRSEE